MNKAILVGRITKDLEVRKTTTNKSILSFSIAVNKGKDKAEFIDIQCWEQRADYLGQYATKGTLISVVGRIESNVFTNKNNIKVRNTYVVAEEVAILSKPQNNFAQNQQQTAPKEAVENVYLDDIDAPWM